MVAYLIGQLAKNDGIEKSAINLSDILAEIYAVINSARLLIGGRLVILECENSPSLINHYSNHGFAQLGADDAGDGLITMYRVITD